MKKIVNSYKDKKETELQKDVQKLREEIAKLQLERESSPPKDTNTLRKKKHELAVLLTVIKEGKNK